MVFEMENIQDSPEFQHLTQLLNEQQVLLFVGAGVSLNPPAGLPDWHKLRDYTLEAIASKCAYLTPYLEKLTAVEMLAAPGKRGMTPEVVASEIAHSCPKYFESFQGLETGTPNENHQYLAKMSKLGRIPYILTTNYDTFIERGLEQEGLLYSVYRTDEEFASFKLDLENIHVLKLHGCITVPETITATIEKEAQGLSKVRSDALKVLLNSLPFIFWGYSGWDLKIDLDYLSMKSELPTAKGFVWSLYQDQKYTETPNPYILELKELYQENGLIGHALLPDCFDNILDIRERPNRMHLSENQKQVWQEEKNKQFLTNLYKWADEFVDPIVACSIFGRLLEYNVLYEDSIKCYEYMAEMSSKNQDSDALEAAINSMGNVYKSLGKNADAFKKYKKAEKLARDSQNWEGLKYILGNLGDLSVRWGKFEHGLHYYKEAEEIAIQQKDQLFLAQNKNSFGDLYRSWGKYEKALVYYKEAERIIRAHGYKNLLLSNLDRQGIIYRNWEELDQAQKCFEEIKEIARILGDKGAYNHACTLLASYYLAKNEIDQAYSILTDVQRQARELNDERLLITIFSYLVVIYRHQKKDSKALQVLEEHIQLAQQNGEVFSEAGALFSLAQIHQSRNQYDTAINAYEEAFTKMREIGDNYHAGIFAKELGILYQDILGQPTHAIPVYEKSIYHFRNANLEHYVPEVVNRLVDCQYQILKTSKPPLFKVIQKMLDKEPLLQDSLIAIAKKSNITAENLEVICFKLEETKSREEVVYQLLVEIQIKGNACRGHQKYDSALRYYKIGQQIAENTGFVYYAGIFLNDIGLVYTSLQQPGVALECLRDAENIARATEDIQELITRLYNISTIYQSLERIEEALTMLEEAASLSREFYEQTKLLKILPKLGDIYKKSTTPEASLKYYEEAVQIARDLGEFEIQLDLYIALGKVFYILEQYEASVHYRQKVLKTLEDFKRFDRAALSASIIGNLYETKLKQPNKAIPYYEKAIAYSITVGELKKLTYFAITRIHKMLETGTYIVDQPPVYTELLKVFESEKTVDLMLKLTAVKMNFPEEFFNPTLLSRIILHQMGVQKAVSFIYERNAEFYKSQQQYKKALLLLQMAETITRQIKDKEWLGTILRKIGEILLAMKQYDKVIEVLEEAIQIALDMDNKKEQDLTFYALGKYYATKRQFMEALNYYNKAVALAREINYKPGLGYDLAKVAETQLALNQIDRALKTYQEAFLIFKELKNQPWIGNMLEQIGKTYFISQNYEDALDTYQEAANIARTIHNHVSLKRILLGIAQVYKELQKPHLAKKFIQEAENF